MKEGESYNKWWQRRQKRKEFQKGNVVDFAKCFIVVEQNKWKLSTFCFRSNTWVIIPILKTRKWLNKMKSINFLGRILAWSLQGKNCHPKSWRVRWIQKVKAALLPEAEPTGTIIEYGDLNGKFDKLRKLSGPVWE